MRHFEFLHSRVYELGQSGRGSGRNWLLAFTESLNDSNVLPVLIQTSYNLLLPKVGEKHHVNSNRSSISWPSYGFISDFVIKLDNQYQRMLNFSSCHRRICLNQAPIQQCDTITVAKYWPFLWCHF